MSLTENVYLNEEIPPATTGCKFVQLFESPHDNRTANMMSDDEKRSSQEIFSFANFRDTLETIVPGQADMPDGYVRRGRASISATMTRIEPGMYKDRKATLILIDLDVLSFQSCNIKDASITFKVDAIDSNPDEPAPSISDAFAPRRCYGPAVSITKSKMFNGQLSIGVMNLFSCMTPSCVDSVSYSQSRRWAIYGSRYSGDNKLGYDTVKYEVVSNPFAEQSVPTTFRVGFIVCAESSFVLRSSMDLSSNQWWLRKTSESGLCKIEVPIEAVPKKLTTRMLHLGRKVDA